VASCKPHSRLLTCAALLGWRIIISRRRRWWDAQEEALDVVIDFSQVQGRQIVLQNGAVDVLQFQVAHGGAAGASKLPEVLRPITRIPESEAVRTRYLALGENVDVFDAPMIHLLNGARWHDPVTEKPKLGTTEIWAFINLTEDSHPIHIHLTRFQILDRRSFDDEEYLLHRRLRYTDEAAPPTAGETGWKDTVQAHPKMVTVLLFASKDKRTLRLALPPPGA
jgi:spore coat protein A, manganese oxidase